MDSSTGQLLHCVRYPFEFPGELRTESAHPQSHPKLLLSRTTHHVFLARTGQSTPGIQVGVHARFHWVWVYYDIHDGGWRISMFSAFLTASIGQFSALFLAVKGIEEVAAAKGAININDLFSNSIFRNIVLSLAATLGLYIAASLIFVCPPRRVVWWCAYVLRSLSHGT